MTRKPFIAVALITIILAGMGARAATTSESENAAPNFWSYTSPTVVVIDRPMHLNIPLVPMRRAYLPIVLRDY
jgi:hypothetical protein